LQDNNEDIPDLPEGWWGYVPEKDEDKEEVEKLTEHDKLKKFFFKNKEECECGLGYASGGKHSSWCKKG